MANPNQPGTPGTTGTLQPIDPEEMREIQLLAEAVLVSFTATPNPFAPFGHAKLAWNITMPTTVIPGVHIEVHISGLGDQAFDPRAAGPSPLTTAPPMPLWLRTPLASRPLGTVNLAVDFGTCKSFAPAYWETLAPSSGARRTRLSRPVAG